MDKLHERKMNDSNKSPNGKCLEKFEFVKKWTVYAKNSNLCMSVVVDLCNNWLNAKNSKQFMQKTVYW